MTGWKEGREGVGVGGQRVGGEEGTSISDVSVESVASAMSACRAVS